ncbi:hypothetical protein KOR34_19610 [Posidoniimonas corsicana]|uniref:DNA primase n=1 Tax=Posidoniimonas corsicana TaxID=1938618 RepID=A0A5C5VH20_9BACT|nr:DNA primase [Posidoniimonas corsicana]TWT37015.1 hypothetical protein KOR34_19610 [Posidoniimonas corsicana]
MSRSSDRQPAYGFRIVGDCRSERRLVDWPAALCGYAACDPAAEVESEGYLSAFTFGPEFRQRHDGWRVDVRGYDGPCGGDWLWFDLDSEGDLDAAHDGAKRLCAGLVERYALDESALLIFFSGSKGFHVGLPLSVAGSPPASGDFNTIARAVAEQLAVRQRVDIDTGVFDKVRALRAPNSRHRKTGRYKRRLTFDELLALSLATLVRMAEEPNAFELPPPPNPHPAAVADWQQAAELVAVRRSAIAERRADPNARLNRLTLDFIRDGATHGDRHRLLFSAAANLAEFGCPAPLAEALLSEAALDSGLPPSEVRRQIACGLAFASHGSVN